MFVIKAVKIRLAHRDMPMTTKSVLLILCSRSFVQLKNIVVVDETATAAQCAAAQARISMILGVNTTSLG